MRPPSLLWSPWLRRPRPALTGAGVRTLTSPAVCLTRQHQPLPQLQTTLCSSSSQLFSKSVTKCALSQSRFMGGEAADYKGVSLYHVKYYLKNKSISYTETHPCLKLHVPRSLFGEKFCTEWSKVSESLTTVFVNKVTGSFVVPDLGVYGSWTQLETLLNVWVEKRKSQKSMVSSQLPTLPRLALALPDKAQRLWDSGVTVESLGPAEFKKLLANFKLGQRDLFKKEDFVKFNVKCTQDFKELLFPVKYINGDVIGLKVLRVNDNCLEETNMPEPNGCGILPFFHNLEVPWMDLRNTECVLVGSVLDSVVIAARTDRHVICLPEWTRLNPDLLPFLDQFSAITIWLGSGVQGVETARNFAKKIGDKHCRIVNNSHSSALVEVMKKKEVADIEEVLRSATGQHHQYITTFETLRHDVFLEFLNAEQMEGVKWTRFDTLNETLRGHRRGEMTVITGRTGSGKTTFMSEYSIDLCQQGVSTLWGSFEVQNVRLVRMMLKQFSLVDLDSSLQEFDKVAERFSQLPMYFTRFHGTNEVEKVLDAMAHAVYVHDIAHVIIDNIQFMVGSGNGNIDRFSKQDQCIEMFRKFATLHNVHVTLVIHPRKDMEERLTIQSIFGGGKATQEADNVLLLQTEDNEDTLAKKKYLDVVKNRFSGDLGRMGLQFTKPVLSLSKQVASNIKKKSAEGGTVRKRRERKKSSEEVSAEM